jgi:hypothetical protein
MIPTRRIEMAELTEGQKKLEEKRQRALEFLENIPADFIWIFSKTHYPVSSLRENIERESKDATEESDIVRTILAFGGKPFITEENTMGKRYHCLKCHKEFMVVSKGSGSPAVSCCGQTMVNKAPLPIPSSD